MDAKDFLPILFAGLAVTVSIITYWRTTRISEWQSVLAANNPLVDWAGDVASLIADVVHTQSLQLAAERRAKLLELSANVAKLLGQGMIALAYCTSNKKKVDFANHEVLQVVQKIGFQVNKDAYAQKEDEWFDLVIYGSLIEQFSALIVKEIRRTKL